MTLADQDMRALAYLAPRCRPSGARQWKPDDVLAELAKLRDRSLGSVICAVTRAAMDRHAERPEVIASNGSHWSDTMLATDWVPNSVPPADRCTTCSEDRDRCRRKWAGEHEFQSAAHAARAKDEGTPDALRRVVAALKDEVAHAERPELKTLDDLAATNPALRARVDVVRAAIPEQASAAVVAEEVAT